MITDYSERTQAYFAADYAQSPALAGRLSDAAEVLFRQFSAKGLAVGNGQFLIRDRKFVAGMSIGRMFAHSLGSAFFVADPRKIAIAIVEALDALRVRELKRVGFKMAVRVPMEMKHSEICDLMFGGIVADRHGLEEVFGEIDDLAVAYYSKRQSMKLICSIIPQTAAQASSSFLQEPMLKHFEEEQAFRGVVREFHDRIHMDCLLMDVDAYRENVAADQMESFMVGAAAEIEGCWDRVLRQIRGVVVDLQTGVRQ